MEETIKDVNTNNEEITSKGVEIMIALDVSTSMLCEDMRKRKNTTKQSKKYNTRLYRSTQLVLDLINKLSKVSVSELLLNLYSVNFFLNS